MRTYVVKITCDACGREAPPQGYPPDARDRGEPPRDFVRIGLQEFCTTCAGAYTQPVQLLALPEPYDDPWACRPQR